ncbi:hypothetical protein [Paenibacillus xylaniclasticus]|uniref:hypothetical protein n=1 Tax=Paenibacillus xylaniclasticus TaxID=588083 RepID=UPI000FDB1EF1|nr:MULTISPECIES: hypothetical protein [Paenibacillus]GFN32845.1 hypothetical protein PCURB6_31050 [Paenibacillus curdlanolyticus]
MRIKQSRFFLYDKGGCIAASLLLALMLTIIAGCSNADMDSADTTSSPPTANELATPPLAGEPLGNPYEVAGITDPEAFDQMFAKVQAAIAEDDKAAVAASALYPIRVNYSVNQFDRIDNAEQFIANYDQIITPSVKEALRNQKLDGLFVNANGVMAGAGQMWFGVTATTPQQYGIIAVNP